MAEFICTNVRSRPHKWRELSIKAVVMALSSTHARREIDEWVAVLRRYPQLAIVSGGLVIRLNPLEDRKGQYVDQTHIA